MMLQLNPYAAASKKNAKLVSAKNIRAKALKVAKASKKPAPANPVAVRSSKMKATGLLPNQVSFLLGYSAHSGIDDFIDDDFIIFMVIWRVPMKPV